MRFEHSSLQIFETFTISPTLGKEENLVPRMYIELEFKNAKISNLSDNFLFIFSVRLVGLVNFVSREYEANRYWPTNLDFVFKFGTFIILVEIFEVQYFQKI